MSDLKLTTRQDWLNHWKKHRLVRPIPELFSFHDMLTRAVSIIGRPGTAIELGGYPGGFSVYLAKYCGMNSTLIDYFVDRQTVDSLAMANGLPSGAIKVIQADVFSYTPDTTYDLVCSFGFIEHFRDLEEALRSHLKFMNRGATLLITLPNFRGINGLLQRAFDPQNLSMHNLAVMDPGRLKKALFSLGLENIQVDYYPSTQVWLEGLSDRSFLVRAVVRVLNKALGLYGKCFGTTSRWISNSIVILAKKP